MKQPLIGISTRIDVGSDRFYLRKQYSEAIFQAGGIPVLLPLIPEKDYTRGLLSILDGVLLSGSNSDVDPRRYGEEPRPHLGPVMSQRDQTDWFLLEEVFRNKKPLLGICYGIQILNVFLGGTLWQDIRSEVDGAHKHSPDSPDDFLTHNIEVVPESLLVSLAGHEKMNVNSFHHQGIRKTAPALKPVAIAPDNIVEAVELTDQSHFVLAVQWHPEIGWNSDEFSQRIFSCFTEQARKSRT
jgi:putative glutamine amidotransferase